MGWWLGSPVQRPDRSSHRHKHVGVSPVSCSASSSNPRLGVEVTSNQDRQSPTETGGQVRSDQWAGRRKVNRKAYDRSAGQSDVVGGCIQVDQARNSH